MSKGGVPFNPDHLVVYRQKAHELAVFTGQLLEEHLNAVLTKAARDNWDGDINDLFTKAIAEYMRITLENHDGGEDALGEASNILGL